MSSRPFRATHQSPVSKTPHKSLTWCLGPSVPALRRQTQFDFCDCEASRVQIVRISSQKQTNKKHPTAQNSLDLTKETDSGVEFISVQISLQPWAESLVLWIGRWRLERKKMSPEEVLSSESVRPRQFPPRQKRHPSCILYPKHLFKGQHVG